jgi:hypothetical protein
MDAVTMVWVSVTAVVTTAVCVWIHRRFPPKAARTRVRRLPPIGRMNRLPKGSVRSVGRIGPEDVVDEQYPPRPGEPIRDLFHPRKWDGQRPKRES